MTPTEKLDATLQKVRSTAISLRMTEKQLMDCVVADVLKNPAIGDEEVRAGISAAAAILLHQEIIRYHCDMVWQIGGENVSLASSGLGTLDKFLAAYPQATDPATPCGMVWKGGDEPYTEMLSTDERSRMLSQRR